MSNLPQTAQPIRVLHVIDSLAPAGAEHQLLTLCSHLTHHGIECEVAALQGPYTLQPVFERSGIVVHPMGHRDGRNFFVTTHNLSALLRKRDYDIVHGHLWNSITAVGLSKFRSRKEKRFVTFHNSAYQQFPAKSLVRRLRKIWDRLLLRHAIDECIGVTDFIAASNRELLALPRVEMIFNGLDLVKLPAFSREEKTRTREELGCGEGEYLIVTAGRLTEQKGHMVLIDAIADLSQRGLSIKVVIFGEGSLREKLQNKITTSGLESKISLPGCVEHSLLFRAIAAADLFVFPSIHEPFGLAAAEAMALGTPIIASAVDGLRELVEDGVSGKLVRAGDSVELANAIAALLGDPALRLCFASAAQKHARESFDIRVLTGRLAALYRNALGRVQERSVGSVTA